MFSTSTIPSNFEEDITFWGQKRGGFVLALTESLIANNPFLHTDSSSNELEVNTTVFGPTKSSLKFKVGEPVTIAVDGSVENVSWTRVKYAGSAGTYATDPGSHQMIWHWVIQADDKKTWEGKCNEFAMTRGERVVSFWLDGSVKIHGEKAAEQHGQEEGDTVTGIPTGRAKQ